MKVKCVKIVGQPSLTTACRGIKKNRRNYSSESESFRNNRCGTGYFTQKAEILLRTEVDGKPSVIPIGKQFRVRFQKPGTAYATLSKKRIQRIKNSMPNHVNIRVTGDGSYQVEESDIDTWFSRI